MTESNIIKEGIFLYADGVICDIRIIKSNALYGFFEGDWIDPPKIYPDQAEVYYYIEFGSALVRGEYSSQSWALTSLEGAIAEAEKATSGSVRWRTY